MAKFGSDEVVCQFMQTQSVLVLAWTAIVLVGWYGAWDMILRRAFGSDDNMKIVGLGNPIGLTHICFYKFLQWVNADCTAKKAKRIAAVVVVALALLLSYFSNMWGLGGLRTAVLLAGVAGVTTTVSLDRLCWLGWWIHVFVSQRQQLREAFDSSENTRTCGASLYGI